MLECKNLGIQFGGLKAVDSFNLNIEKGMLYGLIGPNGADKRKDSYSNQQYGHCQNISEYKTFFKYVGT